MRLWNQHPIQGRRAIEIQALIHRFPFCISNMIKDLFKCFLLLKTWISSNKYKGRKLSSWPYTVRFLCLTLRPWDSSRNHEPHGKFVRIGRSVIIWEIFHGRISLNSVFLLLLVDFVSGFRLELTYISLIENIRSSLTHHHGFQLLVLLP